VQACYIFHPTSAAEDDIDGRPAKKRKLSKSTRIAEDSDAWPRLLGGQESVENAALRKNLFAQTWAERQAKLEAVAQPWDTSTADNLRQTVREHSSEELLVRKRLHTVLLVSPGSQNAAHLEEILDDDSEGLLETAVALQPNHCANLQTALKTLIKSAIVSHGGQESYTNILTENKSLIPMNFDLELLQLYIDQNELERVIISITDVEMFETGLLAELITTLHSWSDRISFVLLISICTTIELFESRFSRAIISLLDAQVISTSSGKDVLFRIYKTVQHAEDTNVFLGPAVVNVLAELAEDQGATPESMIRAIKYAYMSHFFANPMSVLSGVDDEAEDAKWDSTTCRMIRAQPNFRTHCETLSEVDASSQQKAEKLVISDNALQADGKSTVAFGRELMRSCLKAISTLRTIYRGILKLDRYTPWEIEVQLLASLPDLTSSSIWRAVEEALTFGPLSESLSLTSLLESMDGQDLEDLSAFHAETESASDRPLSVLRAYLQSRTTPDNCPELDSKISSFKQWLSSAYCITIKSPLSQILHSRPRTVMERALRRPADYLACECCSENSKDGEVENRHQLPPTSLLQSMLNEAGTVVNVRDLWDAFRSSVSVDDHDDEKDEDDEDDTDENGTKDREILALFYRALSEMRYLGLVKQSKRKPGVECLQKTSWFGL
jgi:origin recognition complex subunit 3